MRLRLPKQQDDSIVKNQKLCRFDKLKTNHLLRAWRAASSGPRRSKRNLILEFRHDFNEIVILADS